MAAVTDGCDGVGCDCGVGTTKTGLFDLKNTRLGGIVLGGSGAAAEMAVTAAAG
jgi:hypothetical protein